MNLLLLSVVVVNLWPNGSPGPKSSDQPEVDTSKPNEHLVAQRSVIRLGPVTEPTLSLYPAPGNASQSPAVLVFPGGGYRILAYDLEGTEICSWLNSIGMTAVLVKYRVGDPGGPKQYEQPLQDAQQAMSIVRQHAAEWKIDSGKIGTLGFSAGGHLSAMLNTTESRAGYTVLVYPAYLNDVPTPEHTPPTFVVQAEDDRSFIDGTLAYYKALKGAGISAEMHLFSRGGHGYGLRKTGDPVAVWPQLAETWLQNVTR